MTKRFFISFWCKKLIRTEHVQQEMSFIRFSLEILLDCVRDSVRRFCCRTYKGWALLTFKAFDSYNVSCWTLKFWHKKGCYLFALSSDYLMIQWHALLETLKAMKREKFKLRVETWRLRERFELFEFIHQPKSCYFTWENSEFLNLITIDNWNCRLQ